MRWHPIKLTVHPRTYAFGEGLVPDKLGKKNVPDGIVAETWEISDHRDARATITAGPFVGRTTNTLVGTHSDGNIFETAFHDRGDRRRTLARRHRWSRSNALGLGRGGGAGDVVAGGPDRDTGPGGNTDKGRGDEDPAVRSRNTP